MCNMHNFTKVSEQPINTEETDCLIDGYEFIDLESNYTSKVLV